MGKEQQKKTVGIITMHKVLNFGSVLQAYALQKVIINMGYDCELIDYIYPNKYHKQFSPSKSKWYSLLKYFIPSSFFSATARDNKTIKRFAKKHLNLSHTYKSKEELQNDPPLYDIYITGSDQVWNPRNVKGDTSFLLSFAPDKAKRISYSASFATSEIGDEYLPAYKKMLSKYSHISVRETSGQDVVKNLTGKDATVVLDPTLLLAPEEWSNVCVDDKYVDEEYIFAYVLDYTVKCTPYIYDLIKYIQKKSNCRVIYLDQKRKFPEELKGIAERPFVTTPDDFISLFKNAKLVITSSFHGTAFAANFGVPLYSVIDSDIRKDSRQLSLLTELGIANRAIRVNEIFNKIDENWDVEVLQKNLNKLRECSKKYLLYSLVN